jgi:hypothetical protein
VNNSKAKTSMKEKRSRSSGFGLDTGVPAYHFLVKMHSDHSVTISEHFPTMANKAAIEEEPLDVEKARITAYRWGRIADAVAQEFNGRLLADGLRSGRWLKTQTPLAPYFGKELTLLAWAIEDAEPTILPMMIANWRGLAPEERWWFYTTINATANRPDHGKDRGWRKAIKIAFADNPIDLPPSALLVEPQESSSTTKRPRTRKDSAKPDAAQGTLRLFDDRQTPRQ